MDPSTIIDIDILEISRLVIMLTICALSSNLRSINMSYTEIYVASKTYFLLIKCKGTCFKSALMQACSSASTIYPRLCGVTLCTCLISLGVNAVYFVQLAYKIPYGLSMTDRIGTCGIGFTLCTWHAECS